MIRKGEDRNKRTRRGQGSSSNKHCPKVPQMPNPIEHAACANHRDHIGELWTQITRIDSAKEGKTGSKKASLRISLSFSESPPDWAGERRWRPAVVRGNSNFFSSLSHGTSSCHCFLVEEI
jgi:hypothetical protein